MTNKVNTVIFDLDGTLLYTLEDLTDSVNYALSKHGLKTRTIEEIKTFVGSGVRVLMQQCVPVSDKRFEDCLICFKEHYSKNMFNKTAPYEGILDMLESLNKHGIRCAVVSNKFDTAVKKLCRKYFEEKIILGVGECENILRKPYPDGVLAVMNKLNTNKSCCIFAGDSEVDILTAQNAGIPSISVNWGYKDTEFLVKNNAQKIVSSPEELNQAILEF